MSDDDAPGAAAPDGDEPRKRRGRESDRRAGGDLFGQGGEPAQDGAKPVDDRHGHRARLRARFMAGELEGGSASVADYELLELVLFRAIPRRDVKPLAKRLLKRFGGFAEAVSAPAERLREVDGLGEAAIIEFKIIGAAARALARARAIGRPVLSGFEAVIAYCATEMAHRETERFKVLYLDKKNVLIADETLSEGTVDQAPVYPREVIKRALALNATALILAHNHPSGDPTPSRADIEITRRIMAAARTIGVEVHDHIVIGKTGHASLRALGHLAP